MKFVVQALFRPLDPHLAINSVDSSIVSTINGETLAFTGITISYNASVGHDPMQERQPTHASILTITGLFFLFGGHLAKGRSASNGQ